MGSENVYKRQGASGVRIWKDGVETTTAPLDIGRPTGFGNNLICR